MFPQIQFKWTNTDSLTQLEELIEEKLSALEKFIGDETDVQCSVEFEKVTASNSGPIYRVEVNLWLGGKLYRAEATEENFEKAIDEVRDELDKELRRDHRKRETLLRRGGRKLKELLRFGRPLP